MRSTVAGMQHAPLTPTTQFHNFSALVAGTLLSGLMHTQQIHFAQQHLAT
jgi:hypothetical protein